MKFRIASLPGKGNPANPYVDLFYDALATHGIELTCELKMDIDWLIEHLHTLDALHFHWPETTWKSHRSTRLNQIAQFLHTNVPGAWRISNCIEKLEYCTYFKGIFNWLVKLEGVFVFQKFIKVSKKAGIRIIWTIHNIEIHEGTDWQDKLGYYFLKKSTDLFIFHSETSKNEYLARNKINGRLVVMPHGNYDGFYPVARPKNILLQELGLRDDLPIISCLGMLRNYKGLDVAAEAISLLGSEVQFLCAGWPHPSFDIDSLQSKLAELPNALLIPRFLTAQEFSDYVSISDIILMPYNKITGSGALLAALTLGRSVIVSDLQYFREILENNHDAGRLVPARNPVAFAKKYTKLFENTPKSSK